MKDLTILRQICYRIARPEGKVVINKNLPAENIVRMMKSISGILWFFIRMMLLIVLCASIILMNSGKQSEAETGFFGARTQRDEDGQIIGLHFADVIISDADLERLQQIPSLKILGLRNTGFSRGSLSALKNVTGLTMLELGGSTVTDEQLATLPSMPNLRSLSLEDTQFLNDGIAQLPALPALQQLVLVNCAWVEDDDLRQMLSFPTLTSLNIGGCPISDDGIAALKELPSLSAIHVSGCTGLTEKTFEHLAVMPELRIVSLRGIRLSLAAASEFEAARQGTNLNMLLAQLPQEFPDADQAYLRQLFITDLHPGLSILRIDRAPRNNRTLSEIFDSVQNLQLSGPETDDRILPVTARLKNLRELTLSGSRLSDKGLEQIGRTCPGLDTLRIAEMNLQGEFLNQFRSLRLLDLSDSHVAAETLDTIPTLSSLQALTLSGTQVTDQILESIGRSCTSLHSLRLARTPVTGSTMQHFQTLVSLDMSESKLTDEGLRQLAELPGIRELNVSGTSVTGSLLPGDKVGFPAAESLDFANTHFSGKYLPSVLSSRLTRLILSGTELRDEDLSAFSVCQTLAWLSLSDTQIDGSGLGALKNAKVQFLSLAGTKITDAQTESLSQLSTLSSLSLARTAITGSALSRISFAQPIHPLSREETESETTIYHPPYLLNLSGTMLSDKGIMQLNRIAGLSVLDLRGVRMRPELVAEMLTKTSCFGLAINADIPLIQKISEGRGASKIVQLAIDRPVAGTIDLLAAFPSLNVLQLSNADFDVEFARTVKQACLRQTFILELSHCRIEPGSLQVLTESSPMVLTRLLTAEDTQKQERRQFERERAEAFLGYDADNSIFSWAPAFGLPRMAIPQGPGSKN